ncbi:MAG: hypothetical protein CM15mP73_3240 [Hyphomicrobiales bacterium]|nr:MAG: hypothetical protein CM15mP73_3240 [Hyphomicrobiales bacterium]
MKEKKRMKTASLLRHSPKEGVMYILRRMVS